MLHAYDGTWREPSRTSNPHSARTRNLCLRTHIYIRIESFPWSGSALRQQLNSSNQPHSRTAPEWAEAPEPGTGRASTHDRKINSHYRSPQISGPPRGPMSLSGSNMHALQRLWRLLGAPAIMHANSRASQSISRHIARQSRPGRQQDRTEQQLCQSASRLHDADKLQLTPSASADISSGIPGHLHLLVSNAACTRRPRDIPAPHKHNPAHAIRAVAVLVDLPAAGHVQSSSTAQQCFFPIMVKAMPNPRAATLQFGPCSK